MSDSEAKAWVKVGTKTSPVTGVALQGSSRGLRPPQTAVRGYVGADPSSTCSQKQKPKCDMVASDGKKGQGPALGPPFMTSPWGHTP